VAPQQARGTECQHSDVDFLAAVEPGRTFLDLARLELRLERLLGRSVDVETDRFVITDAFAALS